MAAEGRPAIDFGSRRVDLESARAYTSQQIARLPEHIRILAPAERPYLVEVSPELSRYQKEVEDHMRAM